MPFRLLSFIVVGITCLTCSRPKDKLDGFVNLPLWIKVMADQNTIQGDSIICWTPGGNFAASSLFRYPRLPVWDAARVSDQDKDNMRILPLLRNDTLRLISVRNEQVSSQLVVFSRKDLNDLGVEISSLDDDLASNSIQVQARFMDYVPVVKSASEYSWSARYEEIHGLEVADQSEIPVIGDPLISAESIDVPAYHTQSIWFTAYIGKQSVPGDYFFHIVLRADGQPEIKLPLVLTVVDIQLRDPAEYIFETNLWFNPFTLVNEDELWTDGHYDRIQSYVKDLVSRGAKDITATIVDDPWRIPWLDGTMRSHTQVGYKSMVTARVNADGNFSFDFSVFDQYVDACTSAGQTGRINAFSMTAFRGSQRFSYSDPQKGQITKEVHLSSPEYKKYWTDFLQSFSKHLTRRSWNERIRLCFDERPLDSLKIIKSIINNAAPEFNDKLSIAGSPENTELARDLSISFEYFPGQQLYDKNTVDIISQRNAKGLHTTFYLCGQPAHPNALTYSPAVESYMIPWMALKFKTQGTLRWSYNNWPADVYDNPVFYYNQGDDYQVYPGEQPISSVRWELFKEGIEDFELIQSYLADKVNEKEVADLVELVCTPYDGRKKSLSEVAAVKWKLLQLIEKKHSPH